MKLTKIYIGIFTAAFLTAPVLTQDFNSLPLCGKSCIGIALSKASSLGCSTSDAKCLCSNVKIRSIIQNCISGACEPSDADKTLSFAISACGQGSAPSISIPPAASTPQSNPAPSQKPSSTVQDAPSTSLPSSTKTQSSASSSIDSTSVSSSTTSETSATFITSTTTSLPSASSLSSSPSGTTADATTANDASLPVSTKIALGITIPLVLILVAALAWFMINRRRNRIYISPYPIAYDGEGVPKMEPEPGVMHDRPGSAKMARSKTIWLS